MNLTILILLMIPFPIISQSFYSNHPFSPTTGLYYLKKGKTKISNTESTFSIHLNVTPLYQDKLSLKAKLIQTQNICNTIIQDSNNDNHSRLYCEQILNLIKDEINEIRNKYDVLKQLIDRSSTRKKRGILNPFSYPFKWLFGTPDANDAQFYTNNVNLLLNDNEQNRQIMKTQNQIISNTIKHFKNSLSAFQTYENAMNENIKQLNTLLSQTNTHLSRLYLENLIVKQVSLLRIYAETINNRFSQYIETINLANNNIIPPLIITPDISNKIKINFNQLFPTTENINFQTLYKLLKLKTITEYGNIIFELKLPLIKKETYTLYKLISIPIKNDQSSLLSYVIPRSPYLLISESSYTYLNELSDCSEYSTGQYLCHNIQITRTMDQPTCEVQLLSPHSHKIPADCDVKTSPLQSETWKYIPSNQWVYFVQHPTTLTIICEKKQSFMEDITIHETGMIKLDDNCKGYTNTYVLETVNHKKENMTYYIPNSNIIPDDCCTPVSQPIVLEVPHLNIIHTSNVDTSDLKYTSKKLNETEKILSQHSNQPYTINEFNWISMIISFIGITITIIFMLKCCLWFNRIQWLRQLVGLKPRINQGQSPTVIENYVYCSFDSEVHPPDPNGQLALTTRAKTRSQRTSESDYEETIPTLSAPLTRSRNRRSSTIPI